MKPENLEVGDVINWFGFFRVAQVTDKSVFLQKVEAQTGYNENGIRKSLDNLGQFQPVDGSLVTRVSKRRLLKEQAQWMILS